jgi:hypothetical protein
VDVRALTDERRFPRTAKSCGPGAPMSGAQVRDDASHHAGNGGKRNGSPRRARISRNPSRREGRSVSACTCGFRARAHFFCARAPGAAATRPSLRPLFSTRAMNDAKLGRIPSREHEELSRLLRSGECLLPRPSITSRGCYAAPLRQRLPDNQPKHRYVFAEITSVAR